jgi:hypothetical protein
MRSVGNQPKFDFNVDLKRGEVGEDLLQMFLEDLMEGNVKFEVKTDSRINETGNIYVETHKYRDDPDTAVLSGINVTEAKWWVQASPDGTAMIVMKTDALRDYIALVDPPKASQSVYGPRTAASLGLKVSLKGLLKYLKLGKVND